jgi:hypothetical protein
VPRIIEAIFPLKGVDNVRFLITMSAALACEAGQTLVAMPLTMAQAADMLGCKVRPPQIQQNQALQSSRNVELD